MSLETRLVELKTVIDQTLGPDGSITKTLGEIKSDLKDGAKVMDDHHLRLDRLEQTAKARSKILWATLTAWIAVVVAWTWDHLGRR